MSATSVTSGTGTSCVFFQVSVPVGDLLNSQGPPPIKLDPGLCVRKTPSIRLSSGHASPPQGRAVGREPPSSQEPRFPLFPSSDPVLASGIQLHTDWALARETCCGILRG